MTIFRLILLIFFVFTLTNCDQQSGPAKKTGASDASSLSLVNGQKLFAKNCVGCHGRGGKGTDKGPPLIHKIYEPSHHNDTSFYRVAESGVRAHHWQFGDMPPVKSVSKTDMTAIINYVRHQQRQAGIR